jgi:phenylpropionate dioxygenase-like ring-hydroxylating dioxygenase large terminal subunit
LVWVVPTVGAELDIAKVLGEKHDAEVADTGIASSFQVRKETWKLDMNWKIAVDGVQDSYHLCQLHTKAVCNFLEGNITAFDLVDRSWRIVVRVSRSPKCAMRTRIRSMCATIPGALHDLPGDDAGHRAQSLADHEPNK